jgi:hypothetical protein
MMRSLKQIMLSMALVAITFFQAKAQDDINELLKESVKDGEKLIGAYIDPAMKSISISLNQGWYNTAKPHKIAGFDLTFTANMMRIPSDQYLFKPANLNLEKIELVPDSQNPQGTVSTIFGPDKEPHFRPKGDNDPSHQFTGPAGIDLKKNTGGMMPVPMAQLGFGLPKGFDIKFRFVPKLDLGDDSQFNMWGIGIMHDVKQWIPGIKSMPFDLSAFIGYTKLKATAKFTDPDVQNGRGIFDMNATTIQGVISKKISVLTLYGGMGYNIAKSSIAMLGTYTIDESTNTKVTDPINLKFAASGPRVTAGFRLKLAVFSLHADYTLQKYSCLTAGFGITVR